MTNEILIRTLSSIILVIITFFCIVKGSYFFIILLIVIFSISSIEWHNMSKNKPYYIFGFIYLIISIFFVYKIITFIGCMHFYREAADCWHLTFLKPVN